MMASFCSQKSGDVDCGCDFGQKAATVGSGDDKLTGNKQYQYHYRKQENMHVHLMYYGRDFKMENWLTNKKN
jgi:hypothetical protein